MAFSCGRVFSKATNSNCKIMCGRAVILACKYYQTFWNSAFERKAMEGKKIAKGWVIPKRALIDYLFVAYTLQRLLA